MLVRPLCTLIVSFAIIAAFSPALSLSLLALNIPYFFAVYKVNRRFFTLSNDRTKAENKASGILVDSIANAGLVKYSGSFFTEQLYFYKHLKQAYRLHAAQGKYQTFSRFAFHAADTVFLSVSILLILFFAKRDNIALDNLFYVYTTLSGMVLSIMLINNFSQFSASLFGSLKANFDIINLPPDISEKENAKTLHASKASITFQNVSFSYVKDRPVFQNLNLKIEPGQKIGLVGHSGSGKSTLVNLLLRSYDVTAGKILINHTDIRDLKLRSLHQNVAVVPQDTSLLNRSITENLRIANSKATTGQIRNAARLACIHDTIMKLPQGYDSVVGERGILLSGGERQRIAIARAILQNAPVLILDEATSALDSQSESLIEKALQNLIKDKTVIAVAHRLSTLHHMNRIIVLDNGKIAEDGSPAELLNRPDGIFRKLCQMQNNGYLTYGENQ